jgi:hypothetical protein
MGESWESEYCDAALEVEYRRMVVAGECPDMDIANEEITCER